MRLAGIRLTGPSPRATASTVVAIAAGEYHAPGFEIAPGDRVLDAGANVGAFAVLAATRGAEVMAYEPHPETFEHLRRNAASLRIRPVQAALVAAGSPATARLSMAAGGDTGHSLTAGGDGIEVPARTLEDALTAGCDLLKLDVEGAEFGLIAGTAPEVLRRARRIVCEVHGWAGDAGELADRLRAAGYDVTVRDKGRGLALLFARLP